MSKNITDDLKDQDYTDYVEHDNTKTQQKLPHRGADAPSTPGPRMDIPQFKSHGYGSGTKEEMPVLCDEPGCEETFESHEALAEHKRNNPNWDKYRHRWLTSDADKEGSIA